MTLPPLSSAKRLVISLRLLINSASNELLLSQIIELYIKVLMFEISLKKD